MTRLTSILFALLILSQSAAFGMSDIFRLGDFMEHASYHAENYGDNFTDFLAKHYGNLKQNHKKEHPDEKQKHEKLPFQHDSCHHSILLGYAIPYYSLTKKAEIPSQRASIFFYLDLYSSFRTGTIFQPPKQA
jgi:hypothetical protein